MPALPLIDGNQTIREIRTLADQDTLRAAYTERARRVVREAPEPFFPYLAQRTVVVVLSDNGPWLAYGSHAGSTGGLREGKGTAWEGGVRVPAIVRWPGTVPPGTVSSELATAMDLLPTLVAAAGARAPQRPIDGVGLLDVLRGDPGAEPRDELACYYGRGLRAVRKGAWKLVLPHRSQTHKTALPGKDGWPGEVPVVDVPQALYDLRADPGETLDVQAAHPDVVASLLAIADRYRRDLGDELTGAEGAGLRMAAP